MMDLSLVRIDLNASWGPEDAGRELDVHPPAVLAYSLAFVHQDLHRRFVSDRTRARRRPWRWHTLRGLAREERRLCREVSRRAGLLADVLTARMAGGEE